MNELEMFYILILATCTISQFKNKFLSLHYVVIKTENTFRWTNIATKIYFK